jgi:hypothetical protein
MALNVSLDLLFDGKGLGENQGNLIIQKCI